VHLRVSTGTMGSMQRPSTVPAAVRSSISDLAELPDERLVDETIAGDRDAFGALVLRHQRGLVNYIFRLVGSRDAATDLSQEVFLKVFVSLDSFDPRFRFTTWLYRIASNRAIDHLRRRQPRTLSLTQPASGDEAPPAPVIAGTDPSPDDVLRGRELGSRIGKAIAALPTSYRQLILLRHSQNCRYDEIARITGLPLGTVKNRIFRAREILRERLVDVLGPESHR
jgi:RNA polymerase sigma-70 factor (ECF subfamily)